MRAIGILLALCSLGYSQGITSKVLDPNAPISLEISEFETTALQFPDRVTGIYGVGIVPPGNASKEAKIEGSLSKDGKVLVLRAVVRSKGRMTIRMGDQLYTFTLSVGDHADVVTKFDVSDSQTKTTVVTNKQVLDDRPKYNTTDMERMMDLAKSSAIMKSSDPADYKGYSFKTCSFVSDDHAIRTEVTKVHSWNIQDALIVEATVTNNSGSVLLIDSQNVGIAIGKELHPVTYMPEASPVSPGASEYLTAMVIGDYDGSRGRFDIGRNEFRLIVTGDARNYNSTSPKLTPQPTAEPTPQPTPEPTPRKLKKGDRP